MFGLIKYKSSREKKFRKYSSPTFPIFPFLRSLTQKGWSSHEMAHSYHQNSLLQTEWAWDVLFKNFKFKGDEAILDYGCGDGKISALLSRLAQNGTVKGVDISSEMVNFASSQFPKLNYPNLSFFKTQNDSLDYQNNKFDLITSFCVFHLVDEPIKLLQQFNFMLKKEGRIIITFPFFNTAKPSNFNTMLGKVFSKHKLSMSKRTEENIQVRENEDFLRQQVEASGFRILSYKIVDTYDFFPNREEFIAWLVGTLPGNYSFPKNKVHEMASEYVDTLMKIEPRIFAQNGWLQRVGQRVDVCAEKISELDIKI